MTSISFEAELNTAEAQARLQEVLDRLDNRLPLFSEIGQLLADSARENFRKEAGPDGVPWTPLRPATIRARLRRGTAAIRILSERGHLSGSIHHEATNDEARIGATPAHAAIHQLGGTIQKPARAAKIYRMRGADGRVGRRFVSKAEANHVTDVTIPAHSVTIPARPYLGVSDTDQQDILNAAEDWLMG